MPQVEGQRVDFIHHEQHNLKRVECQLVGLRVDDGPTSRNGVARLETALEGFDHFELSVNVGERYDRRRIQRRVGNLVNCFVSVIGYDDVLGMFHRGVGLTSTRRI